MAFTMNANEQEEPPHGKSWLLPYAGVTAVVSILSTQINVWILVMFGAPGWARRHSGERGEAILASLLDVAGWLFFAMPCLALFLLAGAAVLRGSGAKDPLLVWLALHLVNVWNVAPFTFALFAELL
jgi:hypothetical protein